MNNSLHYLFNLPIMLWDSLFVPKLRRVDQLVVISPNLEHLDELPSVLGSSSNITYTLNNKISVNNKKFLLAEGEIALVTTHIVWWKSTPRICIKIIQK